MKKMLTLVLILAIASLANAVSVPTWTGAYNSGTGVVSVSITDNVGQMYVGLAITDGSAVLGNFAMGANAPKDTGNAFYLGAGLDYEGYGEGELWSMIDFTLPPGTPVYDDGEWLVADVLSGTGTATMWAYDEGTEEFTDMGTIVIPEPATIALLCLGGLLIRKK